MRILDLKKETFNRILKETVKVLEKGGLIIYPTETCYGAGVDATNKKAVEKLLQYKSNRKGKAVSVAVADREMAQKYVKINKTALNLYQNFLPGPLTVVSESKGKVVPELESENKTLGIRIPDYPLIVQLIKAYGKPITATSANTSGKPQPYSIKNLLKYTSKKSLALINLILDSGKLAFRPVSSVVDTTFNELKLLRQGKISIPQIKGQHFISQSENQTREIGAGIFRKYKKLIKSKTMIFCIQGELGAGKTQLVKGMARALNIKTNVPSPTFILMREYPYKICKAEGTLYHVDTWRMENPQELFELGIKNMLKPGNVICIEWLQKVKPLLEKIAKNPKVKLIWVIIDYISEKERKIRYK